MQIPPSPAPRLKSKKKEKKNDAIDAKSINKSQFENHIHTFVWENKL